MTWAKVDDHANEHRKQLAAGAEACWLWTCGLMYANRQAARDGFIPEAAAGMLFPFKTLKKLIDKLVEVGLWKRVKGGYQIHEFTLWNQTKEQRAADLKSGRDRAAKSYQAKKAKTSNSSPEEPSEESAKNSDSSGMGVEEVGVLAAGSGSQDPDPDLGQQQDPAARDVQAMAAEALRDPTFAPAKYGNVETWPELVAVADAFEATWGRPERPRHQGDPRARAILGRFAEGYTVAQLQAAIRGSKFADYIVGNQANQALVTILRDAAQVDKFSALTSLPPAKLPRASERKQPEGGAWRPEVE